LINESVRLNIKCWFKREGSRLNKLLCYYPGETATVQFREYEANAVWIWFQSLREQTPQREGRKTTFAILQRFAPILLWPEPAFALWPMLLVILVSLTAVQSVLIQA